MMGMIEKIYSEAVFELGIECNNLDSLYGELTEIVKIFDACPEFSKLLSAPTISFEEKISIIEQLFKDRVLAETYNFLCVIIQKNRIKYLNTILEELKTKYNEHKGIAEMTVTTVLPIKPQLKEKLIAKLELVTGKKVSLIEKIDKSILGGIILNYGNTQMDSSIKAKLDAISSNIKLIIA